MKALTSLLASFLIAGLATASGGFPTVDPKHDDFEVLLSSSKGAISCFHHPSQFFVILKNKTKSPKRLFEYWNSWGYQNISFYFYTDKGAHVINRKEQDFTRNFPSTYEIPPGETMVFPLTFNESWDELSDIPEGESKVRIQVVYTCNPTFEAKEEKAWTGIVASKVYEVTFWRAPASTLHEK